MQQPYETSLRLRADRHIGVSDLARVHLTASRNSSVPFPERLDFELRPDQTRRHVLTFSTIMKNKFLGCGWSLLVAAALFGAGGHALAADKQPNIVFIMGD